MARAPDAWFRAWVDQARETPIAAVIDDPRRGLRLRGRVERVGPCPNCGGRDRFQVNTFKGRWLCRSCRPQKGAGNDVIGLVRFLDGCDFLAACETLTGQAPPRGEGQHLSVAELAQLERERAERVAAAEANSERYRRREIRTLRGWWEAAERAAGSPVEAYLALRRCTLPRGACLRYRPAAELWADGKKGAALVHVGPAMVGAILGPEGRFTGLHTTWIDLAAADGKALVPNPDDGEFVPAKKMRGSVAGGRIELVRHPEPWHVVMGEGNETTLSMHDDLREAGRDLDGVAFWSGLSLGNIGGPAKDTVDHPTQRDRANRPRKVPGPVPIGEGIPIPDSVTRITLLRDGDSDPFLTDCALERASLRWARPGRIIVAAEAPAGTDFNNLRRGR